MSNFYNYSPASTHGKFLQALVALNQDADRAFEELAATMTQMLDGDGSQDADYATIQVRFGFDSVAVAHAAYSELMSAFSKTSGDGQTDHVRTARDQMAARFTI